MAKVGGIKWPKQEVEMAKAGGIDGNIGCIAGKIACRWIKPHVQLETGNTAGDRMYK